MKRIQSMFCLIIIITLKMINFDLRSLLSFLFFCFIGSGIFRSLPQNDDYDSTQPKNGLFTIHYAKKDVNNIKDTKSLESKSLILNLNSF